MLMIAAMGDAQIGHPAKAQHSSIADLQGTAIWNRQQSVLPFLTPISKVAAHGNWRQAPRDQPSRTRQAALYQAKSGARSASELKITPVKNAR